ncbi:MAG TPA: bifunctional (p)ppGpp synthetase/guanosine-3',5'-bis(diphosphate) 3'-pyrophosphohydrolase, partial [Saprospiraceae bacterium]|nr:bifunctional (p)ppGpp synthetase/guanosine-3',5'-bis(diphosphate) 3'-pyrophosphohydrolase [Saprospiraceae bacterium]
MEDEIIIQEAYAKLLEAIRPKMDNEDRLNIQKAFELAKEAHKDQRRKSGEPYITHPISVAIICAEEIELGPTAVIAALLHDVVEDTAISLEELRQEFGDKIATIVDGLTKLDSNHTSKSPQAENFRKVLRTLLVDVRVVLIKIADRLHNMRTIGSMPKHKQQKIAAETKYIYIPLAHRLGIYNIKSELEDLWLKITDRETYNEISRKLNETKKDRTEYINNFVRPLHRAIKALDVPFEIIGRPKSIFSIHNKMLGKEVEFEEIYDLFAIRIIIDVPISLEKSLCWQVYSIITDFYSPIPERLKDWVTTPKSNGYESLHTTVIGPYGRFVEVQIRTKRMNEIAERGFAAHWKYKGVKDNDDNVYEKWLETVRDTIESSDHNALEFLSDFKSHLFSEEVHVFTPKGDMKVLPLGATALDFAFSIHSEVGITCSTIKVNSKLVPFSYLLKNADQVSVTTSKKRKPNKDWLNFVVTGKAKSRIRAALREEKKTQASFGKEALLRKLAALKVALEPNVDNLARFYGFENRLDYYFAISEGHINLLELKKFPIVDGKFDLTKKKSEEEKPLVLPKAP